MLKTRVLTAVLILAALLPSLFLLPQLYWAFLAALICGIAAWEWGGLIRVRESVRAIYGAVLAALCILVSWVAPAAIGANEPMTPAAPGVLVVYCLAVFFWAVVVPLWLRGKWRSESSGIGMVVGGLVILPAWLALVQLRLLGPEVLLAILAVVWVADIAAYFAGKAFGRHKLAPSISPGKTWEGAMGAVIGVLAYGLGMRYAFDIKGVSLGFWILGLLAVTVVSVLGDLLESLLKRQAGIKDSSHILPGHGGVLDRIDSLTSTLPTVALLWLLFVVNSQ